MANPFKMIKDAALGTTVGKVTAVSTVLVVSGVGYKLYHDERTGDVVGAERVEKTVAKNDAQGDVRLKMEGLKETPKDTEAEKAKAEAEARAAEEARKAEEAAKLEEALKAQREAEEAAALAEQQAQDGENPADEEQNSDEPKDEEDKDAEADENDGETDADADAEDNEKGPDSFKDGDGDDTEMKDKEGEDENKTNEENKRGEGEGNEETKEGENKQGETDEKKQDEDEGKKDETDEKKEGEENKQDKGETKQGEDEDKTKEEDKQGEDETKEGEGEGKEDENKQGEDETNEEKEGKVVEEAEKNENEEQQGDAKQQGDTPETSGKTDNSAFRHNNFGTNEYSSETAVSPQEIMDEARGKWVKLFEGAAYTGGVLTLKPADLKRLGAVPIGSWSQIATGVNWVICNAASRENSTVRKLVLEDLSSDWEEVCNGIGQAANDIGSGDFPLRGQSFEIDVGFSLTNECVNRVRKSASMYDEGDSSQYWQGRIGMSCRGQTVFIYQKSQQRTPQVDPAEETRRKLLEKFRTMEIANVDSSDYKYAGIAWAVETAMTDSQSKVEELVFDIRKESEGYDQIGVGIREALSSGGKLRDLFSIRVGFSPYDSHKLRIKQEVGNAGYPSYSVAFAGDRVFVYSGDAEATLPGKLRKRFGKPVNGYVYEFELAFLDSVKGGKGLEEILSLAAEPELKVNRLYLRTNSNYDGPFFIRNRREDELKEALKEICAWEEVNRNLRFKTNLTGKDAEKLETEVCAVADIKRPILIGKTSGEVRFLGLNVTAQELQRAVDEWNDLKKSALEWFEKHNGETSWNDICDKAIGSTYNQPFKQFSAEAWCIPLAADPKSKITVLNLGTVAKEQAIVANIKKVLETPDPIRGFDLSVGNDINDIYEQITSSAWYAGCKHKLEICDGKLRIVNGVNTPGSGSGGIRIVMKDTDANAGNEINLEQIKGNLGKEFERAPADAGFRFEFLGNNFRMPWIYAYAYNNDSGGAPLLMDNVIVNEVLEPTEAGFPDCDLVLEATCYYKPGLYADDDGTRGDRTDTRNYFVHSWLRDVCPENDEIVHAKTEVRSEKGDFTYVSKKEGRFFSGEFRQVYIHKTAHKRVEAFLSPNNCVFKVADGASAWFITEFDPNDRKYYNPKGLKFPDGVGKRKIAIHWTFTADDVNGTKGSQATARSIPLPAILPCLFSPKPEERSMDAVKEYLKLKKEKEERETHQRLLSQLDGIQDGESVETGNFGSLEPGEIIGHLFGKNIFLNITGMNITDKPISRFVKALAMFDDPDPNSLPVFGIAAEDEGELEKQLKDAFAGKGVVWERGDDGWFRAKPRPENEVRLLRRLNDAADNGEMFELTRDDLNDDTFNKAAGIGKDIRFVVSRELINDDMEELFLRQFLDNAQAFNGKLHLFAALDNDMARNAWAAFKSRMEKAFADKGEEVFMHLDKHGQIRFERDNDMSEEDKEVLRTKLQNLKIDENGCLKWTRELVAWWCNPANEAGTFAMALAESSLPIKKVDFEGLFDKTFLDAESLFDIDYGSDEWKAFKDDKVLHRYWSESSLKALSMCSGVTFRFVPVNPNTNKSYLEAVDGYNCDGVRWKDPVWEVTVKDRVWAVEDNGCNRLLWNGRVRKLLNICEKAVSGDPRNAGRRLLPKFVGEIADAKTIDGEGVNCIDFTVGSDVSCSRIFKNKDLLGILRRRLALGFTFIVREEDMKNDFLGDLKDSGWKVEKKEDGTGKVFYVLTLVDEWGHNSGRPGSKKKKGRDGDWVNPDGELKDIDDLMQKRFGSATFSNEDLKKFFGKNRTEIDVKDWVNVVGSEIESLAGGGYCDKFIECVKGTDIQFLGLAEWAPGTDEDKRNLSDLVTAVFQECPKVRLVGVSVKIMEDDPGFEVEDCYLGERVWFRITKKEVVPGGDDTRFGKENGKLVAEKKGDKEVLKWTDAAKALYRNDIFSGFMYKVATDLPNVREIDFTQLGKECSDVDIEVLMGYPFWTFTVYEDYPRKRNGVHPTGKCPLCTYDAVEEKFRLGCVDNYDGSDPGKMSFRVLYPFDVATDRCTILLPENFRSDFYNNRFDFDTFCGLLSPLPYKFKILPSSENIYPSVGLLFYTKDKNEPCLDKDTFTEFLDALIPAFKGWCFFLNNGMVDKAIVDKYGPKIEIQEDIPDGQGGTCMRLIIKK